MATCWEAVIDIAHAREVVPDKLRRGNVDLLYITFIELAMDYVDASQESWPPWHHPRHGTVQEKARCIRHDFERLFAELARADVRRVVWSILKRTHECDGAVARLMRLVYSFENMIWLTGRSNGFQGGLANHAREWIDLMGVALWQIACNVPFSPGPPTPPPPYTIYASNIELPQVEWPDTKEPEIRLWSTKSEGSCKRSPVKGTQSVIIQNLLRLADDSSAVSEPEQESRIVELSEDSEEESGAPLPRCTREGHNSPICRQERMRLPSPRRHISLPVPGDTVSARNRFASAEHPADVELDAFSSATAVLSWELRQHQRTIQFDAMRPLDWPTGSGPYRAVINEPT